jgi:Asp-tRNA(Asn)/Glu-tRNA(Gln) amidotransferase A subunit family amidase
MTESEKPSISRRRVLLASLAASGGAAVAGCAPRGPEEDRLWAGFDEHITERTLAEAEKLFGLSFTPAERQLMLQGGLTDGDQNQFEEQVDSLAKWRAIDKPNGLSPATVFDPRLPGTAYPPQENEVTLFHEPQPDLPADHESIAYAPVKQQAYWLTSGQISSLEVTEIYLERIARYNGLLECFVTVTADTARRQAETADRERAVGNVRGPLHGIPYGVKDLADTAGIPTTWGASPFRDRVPDGDAAVVRHLQDAGAVMLGKTTLGALAWGDVWFDGITRNPWNTEEGSSGSSAGSASATAAGLCAFSIGTETWGSIVSPSERCGTTGLRPTHGRVSRAGAMALCWSLDKIGPICRYAEDTALVLAAINGFDSDDAGSLEHGFHYDGNMPLEEMVVGFDPRWFDNENVRPPDTQALEALRETGVSLREVRLPELPSGVMGPLLGAEAAAAFEELTLSGRDDELRRQVANAWPNAMRSSRFFSAVDYVQCERLRRLIMQELHQFFGQADAVFGPSHGHQVTALTNLSGHPVIALRAGFEDIKTRPRFGVEESAVGDSLQRIPRTVRLWGSLFDEGRILNVARALEARLGVAAERPTLA